MTSTLSPSEVLKQDTRGRVRVPGPRRAALLEEFDRSSLSAVKFARLVGVKYSTFAGWLHQRRRRQALAAPAYAGGTQPLGAGGPVRLFEAVLDGGGGDGSKFENSHGLKVELPGGARLTVDSPTQLALAAELVVLIAKASRARC